MAAAMTLAATNAPCTGWASRGPVGPVAIALALLGCARGDPSDTGPVTVAPGGDDDRGDDGDGMVTGESDDGAGSFDDSNWEGTAFEGSIHAMLQFTYSPAHALRGDDVVGIAGGYRTAEASWAVEDFYSPTQYLLAFPDAPSAPDSTAVDAMLPAFDYGVPGDWIEAGNGMLLTRSDGMGSVTGCLRNIDIVDADGTTSVPIYVSGKVGDNQCSGHASVWEPSTLFDVVLYGGDAFGDNTLSERVMTPPALEVTSPNLDMVRATIPAGSPLSFAWDASEVDTRVVIRVVDSAGAVISAHAIDDGSFAIPAADLQMLQPGPIDLVIARERSDRMLFSDGGITVVSRYERWGFFELEA